MSFDVGGRLKEIRLAAGLSQRELAARSGVTHSLISLIEQNRNSPSVASLRKILDGIPMTMVNFFDEARAPRDKVFFEAPDLLDLTSRLHQVNGGESRGQMSFRQVGDAQAHNLQILHESYDPGADTGIAMLKHDSHEGGGAVGRTGGHGRRPDQGAQAGRCLSLRQPHSASLPQYRDGTLHRGQRLHAALSLRRQEPAARRSLRRLATATLESI